VKILFDTNVHVSDAIHGGGATRAITATLQARWKIFVCQTILTEVERVICTKFNRSKAFAQATLQAIRDTAELVDEPASRHEVPGDRDDSPILRAAIGAGVDYLVTRDSILLALNPAESVRIISLTDYLNILQAHGFAKP
jgi:putative PIN family toxin of toxin-antitoxin system